MRLSSKPMKSLEPIFSGRTGNILLRLSVRARINMKFSLMISVTPSLLKHLSRFRGRKYLSSRRGKVEQEIIKAPMPGKIIDVLVREGSTVLRGEPVVILEAMKMQNEILSPVNGVIVKVSAKANTNVMKDDLLVEIKL